MGTRSSIKPAAGSLAAGVGAGTAFAFGGPITFLLVLACALPLLALLTPEVVALLGVSALFMNLPGIAVTVHKLPILLAGSAFLLLLAPLLSRVLLRRESVLLDIPFLLIVAYFGAVLISFFVAKDLPAALSWVTTFLVEGLLTYFLVLNLFRTRGRLERLIDVLILCGAILGGLTVFQHVTGSYTQQFAGLAQRNIEYGTGQDIVLDEAARSRDPDKIYVRDRAGGPMGAPNRYAQIMLCLLPFVLVRTRAHRRLAVRVLYGAGGLLILAAVLLTYSRGGFIGLVVVLALATLMGMIRIKTVAIMVAAGALAVIIWAPGYILRIGTFESLPGVISEEPAVETDGAIRGRITEMLAAFNVFLDHPVIGVGPGQFMPVYSQDYMNTPDALRRITIGRRAHIMYFELAAETGLAGVTLFLVIVGLIQLRLGLAWWRRRWTRPDLSRLAAGFFLSITAYLVTALFLQLAYQRYYWMMLGMAGAALQVLSSGGERRASMRQAST